MYRALRCFKTLRDRALVLSGAWLLFAVQGAFGAPYGCGQNALADAPAMEDMASMPVLGRGKECPHCHPAGGAACLVHGCHSLTAIEAAPSLQPSFASLEIERPLTAVPQVTRLTFPPPLRPPAV
jgi:hypothetical protein